jgi:hypothetical protein
MGASVRGIILGTIPVIYLVVVRKTSKPSVKIQTDILKVRVQITEIKQILQ